MFSHLSLGERKLKSPRNLGGSCRKGLNYLFFVPISDGTCRLELQLEANAVCPGGSSDCAKLHVKLHLSRSMRFNFQFLLFRTLRALYILGTFNMLQWGKYLSKTLRLSTGVWKGGVQNVTYSRLKLFWSGFPVIPDNIKFFFPGKPSYGNQGRTYRNVKWPRRAAVFCLCVSRARVASPRHAPCTRTLSKRPHELTGGDGAAAAAPKGYLQSPGGTPLQQHNA